MKKAYHHKLAKLFPQAEILSGVVSILGVLYFPAEVFEQLNEFCSVRKLTPHQLMVEAFKNQDARFEQFAEEVMTSLKPGELNACSKDPLHCLACGTMRHFIRTFVKMVEDPIGFEQMKKDAPREWSFGAIEPPDW
jgi:hypothetical protein